MTKRRHCGTPKQDLDSANGLVKAYRNHLRGPIMPARGRRTPAVCGTATLSMPPDSLEDVLRFCNSLDKVHLRLSGTWMQSFLDKRIPETLLCVEWASIGVRYDCEADHSSGFHQGCGWAFIVRARVSGTAKVFEYATDYFDLAVSHLMAHIKNAYVTALSIHGECLAWDEANLPVSIARASPVNDTIVGQLVVTDAHFYESKECHLRAGRLTQIALGTFKEVRSISVECTDVDSRFDEENVVFRRFFLEQCVGSGVTQVDLLYLWDIHVDVDQLLLFCLADNQTLDSKYRKLSVANIVKTPSVFQRIIGHIYVAVASGRVKHGFELLFRSYVAVYLHVMDKTAMTRVDDNGDYVKIFDNKSVLRVTRPNGPNDVFVTFSPSNE